jgi:hypothetical protein
MRMKSKLLLALTGLLIVSMLVISPTSARKADYKAVGTLDSYLDPLPAEVFKGVWKIRIENGEVEFKARYLEKNIGEEIPGTLDRFTFVITVSDFSIVDGVCEINGNSVWHKIGWDNPIAHDGPNYVDLPGSHYMWSWEWPMSITIDGDGIEILIPEGGIVGSTLSIHY